MLILTVHKNMLHLKAEKLNVIVDLELGFDFIRKNSLTQDGQFIWQWRD